MRYTAVPNALDGEGIWAAHGVNAAGVGMTATETITSNARVLGADPLVEYVPAKDGVEEISGGIGEEDIVSLVLPYIHSAREGVTRLGSLLEKYGTYEMNGIAFSDKNEIWWLETIGGHQWIARRVPDDAYVVMPNQFGIDAFGAEFLNRFAFASSPRVDCGGEVFRVMLVIQETVPRTLLNDLADFCCGVFFGIEFLFEFRRGIGAEPEKQNRVFHRRLFLCHTVFLSNSGSVPPAGGCLVSGAAPDAEGGQDRYRR